MPFDVAIPDGGYAWWYVDALSPDGRFGLTLILFVGSVFSPWYRSARRRGAAAALDHCALNVSLYGGRRRWTMTERRAGAVRRSADRFAIGPSDIRRDGDALVFRIAERGCPVPRRVRGTVRVHPAAMTGTVFALDAAARHRWSPVAPRAVVEVDLDQPRLRWRGDAYLDTNDGDEPLEHGFRRWDWCRAPIGDRTAILYDRVGRDRTAEALGLLVDRTGTVSTIDPPRTIALPPTRWRIRRETRTDHGGDAAIVSTLQDSPFYARSLLRTTIDGAEALAMHETVDLDRFVAPATQLMLPFRVPRAFRRGGWTADRAPGMVGRPSGDCLP